VKAARARSRVRAASGSGRVGRGGRAGGGRLGLSLLAAVLTFAGTGAFAGCGGGRDEPELTVSAASSLKTALTDYGETFDDAKVRLSFAGSDQLAAQIRAGARPDVFAAANTELPGKLYEEGLVEPPVRFAANRLVVAVRAGGRVKTLGDLRDDGVRLAIGAPSVPIGQYTRAALREVGDALESHVASEEPDVSSIVARVRAGAVDAGIVYVTDVKAVAELRSIELPVRTRAEYAAAVVRGTRHPDEARLFVRRLRGAKALADAGFEP
jgi:molybdate transport system substrate-binding protein